MDYNSKYNGAEVEAILDRVGDCITKGESVDFATDLTGVPEATPEEFTYRPSAGRKSIRDKSAVIRCIKGNTTVWEQRVHNANFSEGEDWWGISNGAITIDPTDGSAKITHNLDNSVSITQGSIRTIPAGHKTLFIVDYKRGITKSDRSLLYYQSANVGGYDRVAIDNIASDKRRVDAFFLTTTYDVNRFLFYPCLNAPVGTVSTIYKVQLFDLTDLFDAGNEPTTIEEFREVYPDDYYPYCEPELRSMRATSIKTVGFNLYNGDYAELIGGKTYYIGGADMGTLTFTPNGTTASEVIKLGDDRTYTPISSGKLSSTYADICVHFQHSGIKDGECADYVEHRLELPEIAKYFPDGMHGIGDVCDEIIDGLAIQRIGEVDLGNSDIKYDSTLSAFYLRLYNSKTLGKGICSKFTLNNISPVNLSDGEMSFHNTYYEHSVIFKATSYTDVTSFKSAMSGVKLYYELVEPVVTPIDEPLQLAYEVNDFGTEKMLSDAPSSPFKADIVYQFNAEGRIRDNSRNIESLEEQIQTLYQGEDTTGSIANTIKRNTISFDKLTDVPNVDGLIKGRDTKVYIDTAIKNATPFVVDPDKNVIFPEKVVARSFEDRDGNAVMLTKDIPTEVATAVPREEVGDNQPARILPNRLYDWTGQTSLNIILPPLASGDNTYYNKWMVLLTVPTSNDLTIPFEVLWKNGVAPTWDTWCICKMIFFKGAGGNITCGEWEIYSYGD